MNKTERLNITIDTESRIELDRQAKKESRSRSAHIRELVKKNRDKEQEK